MLTQDDLAKLLLSKRVLIGYSGGLDSTVLLHLLKNTPALASKSLLAVHVHHGLSPNADSWQAHCQATAQALDIKCIAKSVYIDRSSGESLENLARHARYEVLAALMQKGDVLVTAHHQDDQAETLLLQLFRGAGIKGMAAMPRSKVFAKGILLRPLLNFSRAELESYAKQHSLTWIEDDSNADINFDRNYLRHHILPTIQKKWPSAVANIARSAEHHADAQTILNLQAAQDLVLAQVAVDQRYCSQMKMQTSPVGVPLVGTHDARAPTRGAPTLSAKNFVSSSVRAINIERLINFPESRQKNLLRYWIERNNYQLPSEAVLQQIIQQALYAKIDSEPCIAWADVEIRRYENSLYIMNSLENFDNTQIIPWANQYEIDVSNLTGNLTIQYRKGGERFHPINRDKSQTLKKLMHEWKIPTWLRDRTPLLYQDDKLIAVIGYALAKDCVTDA